jgi:hypothetical protein
MTVAVLYPKPFFEIVLREWNRPRTRVNIRFLRRFVEGVYELLVFLVGEFGGTTGPRFVVDDILERLLVEPFETVELLRGPATGKPVECGGFLLGQIVDFFEGDRRHQALCRVGIIDLRQDLAEVFSRDGFQSRHIDISSWRYVNF